MQQAEIDRQTRRIKQQEEEVRVLKDSKQHQGTSEKHSKTRNQRSEVAQRRIKIEKQTGKIERQHEEIQRLELPRKVAPKLSPPGREFAAIPIGNLSDCRVFIRDNPDILHETPKDFVTAAYAARQAGEESLAKSCIQQSLLLRDLQDEVGEAIPDEDRDRYFFDLVDRYEEAISTFETEIRLSMKRLGEGMAGPELLPSFPSQASSRVASRLATGHHQDNRPATAFDNSVDTDQDRQALLEPMFWIEPTGSRGTITNTDSNAPSSAPEEMHPLYQEQHSNFFVVGRVFATLWHASYESKRNPDQFSFISAGRFQESVISHIQRMVVVKEEYGFSWCIPINTYHGRGLTKFNRFKPSRDEKRQIDAHAIIYMSDTFPTRHEDEPKSIKEPIKVTAASHDQNLDFMSRLNFGKVHTVEHNVKVMNVGRIEKGSMRKFRSYWQVQMAEEVSIADRR